MHILGGCLLASGSPVIQAHGFAPHQPYESAPSAYASGAGIRIMGMRFGGVCHFLSPIPLYLTPKFTPKRSPNPFSAPGNKKRQYTVAAFGPHLILAYMATPDFMNLAV